MLKSSKTLVKSYYQELILNEIIIYSLYGIMYSNLDQREGLKISFGQYFGVTLRVFSGHFGDILGSLLR